ncbi:MAG: ribonuclease P protein component [Acutalibacteraceae bacterium]|nr:ribonuclease P protein component [Acutalibacteraceae bacterium]
MYCFKKLKQNSDFRRIYGRGTAFVDPAFVAYAFKSRTPGIRLGITVSKKIGGAVQRNRAKRILTAAFAQIAGEICSGYDFVLVARTRLLKSKSTDIAASLYKNLSEAGIVKEDA